MYLERKQLKMGFGSTDPGQKSNYNLNKFVYILGKNDFFAWFIHGRLEKMELIDLLLMASFEVLHLRRTDQKLAPI